jgi:hypothetical protein
MFGLGVRVRQRLRRLTIGYSTCHGIMLWEYECIRTQSSTGRLISGPSVASFATNIYILSVRLSARFAGCPSTVQHSERCGEWSPTTTCARCCYTASTMFRCVDLERFTKYTPIQRQNPPPGLRVLTHDATHSRGTHGAALLKCVQMCKPNSIQWLEFQRIIASLMKSAS